MIWYSWEREISATLSLYLVALRSDVRKHLSVPFGNAIFTGIIATERCCFVQLLKVVYSVSISRQVISGIVETYSRSLIFFYQYQRFSSRPPSAISPWRVLKYYSRVDRCTIQWLKTIQVRCFDVRGYPPIYNLNYPDFAKPKFIYTLAQTCLVKVWSFYFDNHFLSEFTYRRSLT
jgi:hypothetical protein